MAGSIIRKPGQGPVSWAKCVLCFAHQTLKSAPVVKVQEGASDSGAADKQPAIGEPPPPLCWGSCFAWVICLRCWGRGAALRDGCIHDGLEGGELSPSEVSGGLICPRFLKPGRKGMQ